METRSGNLTDEMLHPIEYKGRPGTHNKGGIYESKMAALLSLKCALNETKEMWIACNVDECGAFDDIILHHGHVTYLLQLKHKDKLDTYLKETFKGSKEHNFPYNYINDIANLKQSIDSNSDKENFISELGTFEKLYFLLITNSNIQDYSKHFKESEDQTIQFLNTGVNGNMYKIDKNTLSDDHYLCSNNVYLLTNQISVKDIDLKIQEAIENICKFNNLALSNVKQIAEKFTKYITDWTEVRLGLGYYCLTRTEILRKLSELLLGHYEMQLFEERFSVYNDDKITAWDEIMNSKTLTVVNNNKTAVEFLVKYVSTKLVKYCNESVSAWTAELSDKAQDAFYQNNASLKMQMLKIIGTDSKIIITDMYKCLWLTKHLPVLLIITKKQHYENILKILKLCGYCYKVILINNSEKQIHPQKCEDPVKPFFSLEDLIETDRNDLLKLTVTLQGRSSVPLQHLVDQSFFHLIKCNDIINILLGNFNIGNDLEPLRDYFIERKVSKVLIKSEVLTQVKDEKFVIEGEYEMMKVKNANVVKWEGFDFSAVEEGRITRSYKDFAEKPKLDLEQRKRQTVHHLKVYDKHHFEWKASYGSTKNIKQFVVELEKSFENNITEKLSSRLTLLSGPPGMGKSMLMNYIACNVPPTKWVLKIDLNKYIDYCRQHKVKILSASFSQYVEHLYSFSVSQTTTLTHKIFQKLESSKDVIFLLDAFDEIPIRYKEEVTDIITSLHNEGFHICLTTRPHMESQLEEQFNTLSISLKPFSEEDQIHFFTNYFNSKNKDISLNLHQRYVTEFSKKLLHATRKNLSDMDSSFTGIPLQCKLLVRVFNEDYRNFISSKGTFIFNENFDLLYLYRNFIDSKMDILYEKSLGSSEKTLKLLNNLQSLLALKLIFPLHKDIIMYVEKYSKCYYTSESDEIQLLHDGGIVTVDKNSNISFVHRTFAEYLVADWLAENFESPDQNIKGYIKLLINERFSQNYNFLFIMFDRIVAENCPLHLNILNGKMYEVNVNTDCHILNDKCGRSPLHILALHCFNYSSVSSKAWKSNNFYFDSSILDILNLNSLGTENRNRMIHNVIDNISTWELDVFGYSPLDYALASCSLEVASKIYSKFERPRINASISFNQKKDYLNFCALHDWKQLFKILLIYFTTKELFSNIVNASESVHCYFDTVFVNYLHKDKIRNYITEFKNETIKELVLSEGKKIFPRLEEWKTDLHISVIFGSKEDVCCLLQNGIDVNKKDNDYNTALHYAVLHKNVDIFNILLKNEADVNASNLEKNSPLHLSVDDDNQNNEIVTKLISENTDINLQNSDGNTPLHLALLHKNECLAELLLSKNSDVKLENKNGHNALHLAAMQGYNGIVNKLLSLNLNIHQQNNHGDTPLHDRNCLQSGSYHENTAIVSEILPKINYINQQDNEGNTSLQLAVQRNKLDVVRLLISSDANPNIPNKLGENGLHQASYYGHTDIASEILPKINDINQQDNGGFTSLLLAVQENNLDVVKLLISSGANPNIPNELGGNCLHEASYCGHTDIASEILPKINDINQQDNGGFTSLHLAVQKNKLNVIKLLISSGANLNIQTPDCQNCLHIASNCGHTEIASEILPKINDINQQDNDGFTSLHLAVHKNKLDVIKLLIFSGANPNIRNKLGLNCLHLASYYGHTDIASEILPKINDINQQNNGGFTSLLLAVQENNLDVVKLLISSGANPNIPNELGRNCLHEASYYGHTNIASEILPKINDINQQDNEGSTSLHLAVQKNKLNVIKLLISSGANPNIPNELGGNCLHEASNCGHTEIASEILPKINDINQQDNDGFTSLHLAVHKNKLDVIKLLIFSGANPNIRNKLGLNCLHLASYYGHTDIASEILPKINDINQQDNEGFTSLHLAVRKNKLDLVKLLISSGANPNIQDKFGGNCLHSASFCGYTDIASEILPKINDINQQYNDGFTSLQLAVEANKLDVIRLLISSGANPNIPNKIGQNCLHLASYCGHTNTASAILPKINNINQQDNLGFTSFDYAVDQNKINMVKLLISEGANIKVEDKYDWNYIDLADFFGCNHNVF